MVKNDFMNGFMAPSTSQLDRSFLIPLPDISGLRNHSIIYRCSSISFFIMPVLSTCCFRKPA